MLHAHHQYMYFPPHPPHPSLALWSLLIINTCASLPILPTPALNTGPLSNSNALPPSSFPLPLACSSLSSSPSSLTSHLPPSPSALSSITCSARPSLLSL